VPRADAAASLVAVLLNGVPAPRVLATAAAGDGMMDLDVAATLRRRVICAKLNMTPDAVTTTHHPIRASATR
jgi:hypothetical protein